MNKVILDEVNHVIDVDRISDDSFIIDAGAAVGGFVDQLRKQGKNCKVVCIECSKTNHDKLCSRDLPNSDIMYSALIDGDVESITFTEFKGEIKPDGNPRYHQWGNVVGIYKDKLNPQQAEVIEYEVPTTTLQQIFDLYEVDVVDYLKMDIEGAEYQVLFGLDQEMANKIKQISIEVHDESQNDKLKNHLRSLGYNIEEHAHNEYYVYRL